LEYTVSNLQNVNTNIQAARSRIQDTDYARESANLARTQVLQQAGMSMLSQSNQSGQNVMSLLR
jgi:flagellin